MVTHRTTLVKHADKMLVLEGGRAKHYGSKAQVMQAMNAGGAQVVPMTRNVG